MPGGVYNWNQGEVLDAADLNEFVASQVIARFANTAARTAAYGVANAPALQAGLFAWTADNGRLYYYNGTSWDEVGAQVEDGEIVTAKIADSAVTSAKIADGTIVNADVNASAAIAYSKLNLGTSIVNADVSTSAAIAHTKLANATAGQVLLGTTTTGVVTATTVSGDVTITGAGVTAISSGVIVDADINASAAIALSKLANGALPTAITVASANITDLSIVDADVSATAAISRGKIADMSIDTKIGDYTLVLTDANKLIEMNLTSTANTVSVPTNASVAFPIGTQINITQYGTGKTQIVAVTSGTTSVRSTPGSYLRDRYSSATLIKRATDEWYLIGDLSAS